MKILRRNRVIAVLLYLPAMCAAAPAAQNASAGGADSVLIALAVPLLAVAIGIAALWWLLRRYSVTIRGGSGPFRIVQALAVGPRERVVLLEAGDRRVLVGVTPAAVTLLTQWPAHAAPPHVAPTSAE